jgi:hypothetical protein
MARSAHRGTKGSYFFLREHTSSGVYGIHGFLSIYAHTAAAGGVSVWDGVRARVLMKPLLLWWYVYVRPRRTQDIYYTNEHFSLVHNQKLEYGDYENAVYVFRY